MEAINEVDKSRAKWYTEFAYHTSQLGLQDGFNWSPFGWSSGEPEPAHWRGAWMRHFLRLDADGDPEQENLPWASELHATYPQGRGAGWRARLERLLRFDVG